MYTWTDGAELYHHGIKGQKWGVRRFQRKDGSLTKAGLRRYSSDENFRKQVDNDLAARTQKAKLEKERLDAEANLKKIEKELLEKSKIETSQSVANLQSKNNAEVSKGKDIIKTLDNAAKLSKSLSDIATNGVSLYNKIALAKNSFAKEGSKEWKYIRDLNKK